MSWLHRAGSLATADTDLTVTPEVAGWAYSGLEVVDLGRAGALVRDLRGLEAVVVPLSARDVAVTIDGQHFTLQGRDGVFDSVSDWIYVPVGSQIEIAGAAGEVALCTAVASVPHPVTYTPAHEVPVEVRGAGFATRQVTNIATPGSFGGAHRINVCEVLTPGGNWSSWPPHRHDGIADCPTTNEEIYYFRLGKQQSDHGDPEATGYFHAYTVDGAVNDTITLRDGDVYIIPSGYHGPSIAAPEYPMYFLNVLAGPAEDRTMAFCDDPSHHWIRDSWKSQQIDPRVPMTSAHGRVVR